MDPYKYAHPGNYWRCKESTEVLLIEDWAVFDDYLQLTVIINGCDHPVKMGPTELFKEWFPITEEAAGIYLLAALP